MSMMVSFCAVLFPTFVCGLLPKDTCFTKLTQKKNKKKKHYAKIKSDDKDVHVCKFKKDLSSMLFNIENSETSGK